MRGQLTDEIQKLSQELLGIELTQRELRLIPYLQYQMMNEQVIDPRRINGEERQILSKWREAGFILGGASGLEMTKQFWDAINQILWLAYVAHED